MNGRPIGTDAERTCATLEARVADCSATATPRKQLMPYSRSVFFSARLERQQSSFSYTTLAAAADCN